MTDLTYANPFDEIVDRQGRFSPDHARLDGDLKDRLLEFLEGSSVLRVARGLAEDVVDPAHPRAVPMTVLTDGEWAWSGAVPYYLRTYGLAPDPALVAHAEQRAFVPVTLSDDALRALSAGAGS